MYIVNNFIEKLISTARQGIVEHYNTSTYLFNFILTDNGLLKEREGILLTHSLITLLGVLEYKESVAIDFEKSVNTIFDLTLKGKGSIRELALLLWLLAKMKDERADRVLLLLDRLTEKVIVQAETMEIAWVLTALTFEITRKYQEKTQVILKKFAELLNNRFVDATGLFVHRNQERAPWDLRHNIANFADQIYSIYAFTMYTHLLKDGRYLSIAECCSNKICALQGKSGQWWWHYNALTGHVVQKYPVFTVHQDSMAPFALMALTEISGIDFSKSIATGLSWVFGKNELGVDMINDRMNFVKRGIERSTLISKIQKITLLASNLGLIHGVSDKYDQLKYLKVINWEYSYHLGWILYAYNEKNRNLWSNL